MWAEAIASWIRHDALREPLTSINFALEFLIGVAVDLLLVRFGPALGLLCSILIVGPLTVVFSLLTFGDRVLFVNFMPSFIGVYLHYQVTAICPRHRATLRLDPSAGRLLATWDGE